MNIFKALYKFFKPEKIVIKDNVELVRYEKKLSNLKTTLDLLSSKYKSNYLISYYNQIDKIEKAIDEYKVRIGGAELQELRTRIQLNKDRLAEIAKTKSLLNYQRSLSELESKIVYLENGPMILAGYIELLSSIDT